LVFSDRTELIEMISIVNYERSMGHSKGRGCLQGMGSVQLLKQRRENLRKNKNCYLEKRGYWIL